jgi:cytochrome c551/c552
MFCFTKHSCTNFEKQKTAYMIRKWLPFFLIVFTSLSFIEGKQAKPKTNTLAEEEYLEEQTDGKQMFILNCGTCHHPTRDLTGPSIYNVRSRWKNKKLLYEYVRNSQAVIKKDAYAKALFLKWNKVIMTPIPKVTDADIDKIFDYVDGEAKRKGLI